MNTIIASVLESKADEAQVEASTFSVVVLFSGVGLLAALCLASAGIDLSGSMF